MIGVVVVTFVEVAVVVAVMVEVTGAVETIVVVRWLPVPTRYPAPAPSIMARTSMAATVSFLKL